MNKYSRLAEFQQKYETALLAAGAEREAYGARRAQYRGDHAIENARDADVVWNFTMELVESQIDAYLPQPKVTPVRPTPKNLERARIIEDMLRSEMDRLPFENLNDLDERTVKTLGGSAYLAEWDSEARTHGAAGALSVRLIDPSELVPQEGVFSLEYMDYLFLTFEDTKSRLTARYGADVSAEGVDPQTGDPTVSDDTATQVICFYKNGSGGLGCFSWTGNTVLIDDGAYTARKKAVCAECGADKPESGACACGSRRWALREKDGETLSEDKVLRDGRVIPRLSPVRTADGGYESEQYDAPAYDPETGLPLYERIFDENGLPAGERRLSETRTRVKLAPTKLPYYTPAEFPLALRKNVSARGKLLGESDCDAVRDFQLAANKLLSKVNKKLLGAGSYLTKPKDLDVRLSDEDLKPISVASPDQLAMLKSITMQFDVSQDIAAVQQYYEMAKSVLGITDTYQGKPDASAASGRAKEAQIAQAAGRQNSKQVMKNAAYADLFRLMFRMMLAYADEPRAYAAHSADGGAEESVFDRYDFLEQDEAGNWYYEDGFLFSVDESGSAQRSRQNVLEELRTDFSLGAYGDKADPRTMLRYWRVKEGLNCPNAKQMVREWENEVRREENGAV